MSSLRDREYDDLLLGFKDRRIYIKKDFVITGRRRRAYKKNSYKRCTTCGGLVKLPCVLCSLY